MQGAMEARPREPTKTAKKAVTMSPGVASSRVMSRVP